MTQTPSIPHIFHHVWTSGDAMPEAVLAARQTWIDRHPDWEFRIWRPEDLRWLRNQGLFDRATSYAQKADIARYEVLHRFGGVYLDTDMDCLRPLDDLLNGHEFFSARQYDGIVAIGIFGSAPRHPILIETIKRLPASSFFHRGEPLYAQTGPILLDKVLKDGRWETRPGIRVFPPPYFYPYAAGEPWRRNETFPRAYAVHHWHRSWTGQRGVTVRPAELLPRTGEQLLPSVLAVWREAGGRAVTVARQRVMQRLLSPTKKFAKGVVHRLLPPPAMLHGIPWGPGEVLVQTTSGTRLLCPTEDISLVPELALTGTYDRPFIDLIERRLRAGMTFVDVGANVGLFTILAASRVGPGGRVFAYECNPELIGFLRRNVSMNWSEGIVELIPKAAHRDDEERSFRVPRDLKGLGSLTRFDDRDADTEELLEFPVSCERLDVGLKEAPYIDLLKIDVEGGEAAVLDGTSELLDEGRIGMIAIEYREGVLREELREEMEKHLTSLVEDRAVTFHVPGDPRSIPLDEVLTVFEYTQLLIRFPRASIEP
jgi:inositol phosphorylceramide mannosyltransferase catalytic subunit